jgi:CubicO group peptidase (beta-lactamase class C family)
VRRLRFVRATAPLRSRYEYNNTMFLVAGMVVQAASGMPWEQFVRTRILQPLGMRETLTGSEGLETRGNVAAPHVEVHDSVLAIPFRRFDNIGPAGSINSSVSDMARWIRAQLDSLRVDGRRLVSDSSYREMFTPQFTIPSSAYYPAARLAGAHFTAYGLGWFLQDYRGRMVAMHTGSIDGMTALVALMPEERLGMVVYLNLDHAELRHALMYRVMDAYLGGPPRDWSGDLLRPRNAALQRARAAEREQRSHRVRGTRPSLPLAGYAGTFADPDSLMDRLTFAVTDGHLTATWATGASAVLEHWHHDVFLARWTNRALGESFITFTVDEDGAASRVLLDGATEFERVDAPG